ncbi:MSC_0621 family F1-like ATPase epsilon subunit [Mesomycoplasma hyopneumoniae]|uniref:MSC_0621 family F1-like ATPase epsilon subunit n=1 Tax=Mesomycoplasma hyopneumoniae TaxID=2099 RepID=UPI0011B66B99|nr:hypothetical protein [Mesomycoplasma hyopneumoniae]MXR33930.1 hypothetical protein [Mesomycoplasma hyopneumoniae]MXR44370.1 hypothetical protein [Mesomycoplasma hyopneumoniae]MXR57425.1 hypothetical protein [Mesomycoplasma hyopneumoniae]QEA02689.1 hypothetical protein EHI52_05150 [Mesomycoplasma hyopneumoniae]
MEAKLWNFRILTPENKIITLKNCKISLNIEQEKYFAPIQPFIVSNLEFSLIKVEISSGIYYFFAHHSLLFSLEDTVSIHLFEDLIFYKVDKKEFFFQKKAQQKNKNTLLHKLQLKANLEIGENLELYKNYQLTKQVNEENRLKELFFLVRTEVNYA